jgi:hypothetical protein
MRIVLLFENILLSVIDLSRDFFYNICIIYLKCMSAKDCSKNQDTIL